MSNKYAFTPKGTARFPWVNKPDTKFNAEGVYKVDLVLDGQDASDLRAKVDAAVEAAYTEITKDMTPKEAKSYKIAAPYEVEEDDEGRPTGNTVFKFRQNAKIKMKSGETKDIQIAIKDSKNRDTKEPIFGGSIVKLAYTTRPYKAASSKTISVRLDFFAVQLIQKGNAGSGISFAEEEGGFVDEGSHDEPMQNNRNDNDGDY